MSNQGENVITALMGVGLLSLLSAGFGVFGAPVMVLLAPAPLILVCLAAVRKDLRHVRTHGWNTPGGSEDPNDDGGRPGPDEPTPQGPSSDGEQFDWDGFLRQFWEQVDRQPVG